MEQKAFNAALQQAASLGSAAEAAALAADIAGALAGMLTEERSVAVAGFGTFAPEFVADREEGGMLLPPEIKAVFTAGSRLRKAVRRP